MAKKQSQPNEPTTTMGKVVFKKNYFFPEVGAVGKGTEVTQEHIEISKRHKIDLSTLT